MAFSMEKGECHDMVWVSSTSLSKVPRSPSSLLSLFKPPHSAYSIVPRHQKAVKLHTYVSCRDANKAVDKLACTLMLALSRSIKLLAR